MFDQSPKPVYEKQPVRQTSQRIGHLSLSDVGLGAGHPQSFSRIVEYREPSVQHPAKRAVLVERSEEHTSELQSRSDLVCRLLLEKKKITCGFGCDGGDWSDQDRSMIFH